MPQPLAYDDALFLQALRKSARQGVVSRTDIEAAFWTAAWDVKLAFEQQAPDRLEDAEELVREQLMPAFIIQAEQAGFRVEG